MDIYAVHTSNHIRRHARELITKFPVDHRSDLGLVTEEDLRCDSPAGIWETGASKKGGLEPMRRKEVEKKQDYLLQQ